MKLSKIVAAAMVLGLAGQAARAQVPGMPFYPTPTGTGVMVAADYAHPGTDQSIYALRGGLGLGRIGVTALVGGYKLSGFSAQTLYGASAAMQLLGGGLLPLSLAAQVGVGQLKQESILGSSTFTYVPVGAAVRANIPMFPLKPFVVGYYTLGSSDVKNEFRATLGADFNFLPLIGIHAAYDVGTGTDAQNYWGIGAHLSLRLPTM